MTLPSGAKPTIGTTLTPGEGGQEGTVTKKTAAKAELAVGEGGEASKAPSKATKKKATEDAAKKTRGEESAQGSAPQDG